MLKLYHESYKSNGALKLEDMSVFDLYILRYDTESKIL